MNINVAELVAQSFDDAFFDILEHRHTHYWIKGGRGSTKSSFVSIMLVLMIMNNKDCHGAVLRKVGNTLRTSVFNQICWAIEMLGVQSLFETRLSPLTITYKKTGQQILFLGVDDKAKIKSIKLPSGYVGLVWYEETDQFYGMEEIRNLNQSLLRGGEKYWCFYTFNPPKSRDNWVNQESEIEEADRLIVQSSYLDVPRTWLGEQFFLEAEKLKKSRELAYRHEYLGEAVGNGGTVFGNVVVRTITDEEIATFGAISYGLDWGWAVDPFCFVSIYFDKMRRRLYIFHEIYGLSISNRKAAELIGKNTGVVFCDSAEPKSVNDMQSYGVNAVGARKGPGSVERGMRFLINEIDEIIIDKKRTPNAAREFSGYEYSQDRHGNFISAYPDKDNHTIDAVRYAMTVDIDRMAEKPTFKFKY